MATVNRRDYGYEGRTPEPLTEIWLTPVEQADYLLDVRAMVHAKTIEAAIDVARAMSGLHRYDVAADAALRSRPDFNG